MCHLADFYRRLPVLISQSEQPGFTRGFNATPTSAVPASSSSNGRLSEFERAGIDTQHGWDVEGANEYVKLDEARDAILEDDKANKDWKPELPGMPRPPSFASKSNAVKETPKFQGMRSLQPKHAGQSSTVVWPLTCFRAS